MAGQHLLPSTGVSFHFIGSFLSCAEAFSFAAVLFVYFCFCCPCLRRLVQTSIAKTGIEELTACFLLRGLHSRMSWVRFELTFVCAVRQWASFSPLHVAVQLSQHHLLKRLFFVHYIFLPPCRGLIHHIWVGLFPCLFLFPYFILGGVQKSLQMVTAAMKLKDAYSLEGKLWPT